MESSSLIAMDPSLKRSFHQHHQVCPGLFGTWRFVLGSLRRLLWKMLENWSATQHLESTSNDNFAANTIAIVQAGAWQPIQHYAVFLNSKLRGKQRCGTCGVCKGNWVSLDSLDLGITASRSSTFSTGVLLRTATKLLWPQVIRKSPPHLNQWNHKSNLYQFTISPLGKQKTQYFVWHDMHFSIRVKDHPWSAPRPLLWAQSSMDSICHTPTHKMHTAQPKLLLRIAQVQVQVSLFTGKSQLQCLCQVVDVSRSLASLWF